MSRNKAIWLARLLFRRGRLTREEISEAWSRYDENARRMATSTFYDNRHLLEERYGIRLHSDNGYYSLDLRDAREEDFIRQLFRSDDCESDDTSVVYIDEPLPAGYKYVAALAAAVEKRLCADIRYEPFDKEGYTTVLAPYCLRTFRSRCYVVGLSSHHGEIRTFALDRISSLDITTRTFRTDSAFSARRYFANSFGAYGGMNLMAEHIVLEADARAAAYLRSRPLHHTQRETSPENPPANRIYPYRFELDVAVSDDFVRELLFYGPELRVLAPDNLKLTLRRTAGETAALY